MGLRCPFNAGFRRTEHSRLVGRNYSGGSDLVVPVYLGMHPRARTSRNEDAVYSASSTRLVIHLRVPQVM